MKINFSQMLINTIDGQKVEGVYKALASAIYTTTKDLDLIDVAMSINRGEEVELTQIQVEEIIRVIRDEKTGFFAFVQKGILDFIKNQK